MSYKFLTDMIAFPKRIKKHLRPQSHKKCFALCSKTTPIDKIVPHPAKHLYVKNQRNRN